MKENKIKNCGNCQYFTGIQCHGMGEYWGSCCKTKKARNDYYFMCYDDTPCLLDVKTMRTLYFKYKEKADKLEYQKTENDIYKLRYESQVRRADNYRQQLHMALDHLYKNKKEYNIFFKEYMKWLKEKNKK